MSSHLTLLASITLGFVTLATCAESRTEPDAGANVTGIGIVSADSDVANRVTEVDVRVEVRGARDPEWQTAFHARFEPSDAKAWPLVFDFDLPPASSRAKCRIRAAALDSRDTVVAEAHTVDDCVRAAADALRATLIPSEQDASVSEPDVPNMPERVADAAIAAECEGQKPDSPFCDGETMRVCDRSLAHSTVRPCGEHERCVAVDDDARCACRPGYVQSARGCEAPDCTRFDAGCRP